MHIAVLFVYFFSLFCIMLFTLFQLQLAWNYIKDKKEKKFHFSKPLLPANLPFVTIQLPIFNESYMVERLIANIAKLDYPKDKFEIQVLDDSTDETSNIIKRKINELKDSHLNFSYIHRTNRSGFKAGALKNGLKTAGGELLAIFDADFLPHPDFLLNTIPYFCDEKVGAIQTRWGHLNKNYSLMTRIQAFALDVHFTIEKVGRNRKGYFIEFNGTSGVWRKSAILDAGNWQADTLTEDLDLSYRSQLKGWKIKYLEDVVSPAELPVEMNAIKIQQFRWMKGGTQNFLKNYRKIIQAPIPFMTKVNGIFYLLNSTVFLFSFLVAILTYPVMLIQIKYAEFNAVFTAGLIFLPLAIFPLFYYGLAYFSQYSSLRSILLFPFYFCFFLIVILGLSLHNVVAVMEAFLGIKSSFLRTPKFNIRSKNDQWKQNRYLTRGGNYINILELIMAVFFLWCIIASINMKHYTFILFFIILFLGFSLVSFLSLKKVTL